MGNPTNNEVSKLVVMGCRYQADITYPGQKKFDCGKDPVSSFVRNSFKKHVADGNCAGLVLIDENTGELIGMCSYTAYTLERTALSGVISGSLPREVGVIRLVMLGVATKHQKKGYGLDLLRLFFEEVKGIHKALPVKGVYLDADPDAIDFYARLGFVKLNESPNSFGAVPMFLGIQHILAA